MTEMSLRVERGLVLIATQVDLCLYFSENIDGGVVTNGCLS